MTESPPNTELFAAAEQVAANHRWTWHRATRELLATVPGAAAGQHPIAALRSANADADADALATWLSSNGPALTEAVAELDALAAAGGTAEIAYFSPEFGVAAEVPQYSGGLGILAGDHLKSASDLALPLVGIGLMYRQGFFRQDIVDGLQTEHYEEIDPESIGATDTGKTVVVEIEDESVTCRIWLQMVGATKLILLDTDVAGNSGHARSITDRLYSGDRLHRLEQEFVLGIGGVRALRALGIAPKVFHLNEGHACFLLLELLAEHLEAGATLAHAVDAVRNSTLFTTHTPVPAGIDRFERTVVTPALEPWAKRLGVTVATLLDWATLPSDGPDRPFNTAAFAFELCGRANGVSQLHSTVSRELFASLPRAARVTGITNGVHARTWVHPDLSALYDDALGSGWENGSAAAWSKVDSIDSERFDKIRSEGRHCLVDLVASTTGTMLDPELPVLGFARRFATYKRAALMLRDPKGLDAALEAGAQFVFAGKAHPADNEGKAVLAKIAAFAQSKASRGRFVIVPDYDISVAQTMYAGCDVWLNNPIRPREACGTSGEKSALSGGLNCSILDGWWADWYVDGIGWKIPTSASTDPVARDLAEAIAMNALINTEVLPLFADRDAWRSTVRAMLSHLGPLVTAGRMVDEYDRRFYTPIRQGSPA